MRRVELFQIVLVYDSGAPVQQEPAAEFLLTRRKPPREGGRDVDFFGCEGIWKPIENVY